MPNLRLSLAKVVCLVFGFLLAFTAVASSQVPPNNAYENQQRAIRLLQFDKDINVIPEAELRIAFRFSILDFIYTKEVLSQYAAAEPLLTAYLEDVRGQEKSLVQGAIYSKNRIALLLRKHHPEMAKVIEAKYFIQVDTSGEDYEALDKSGNASEIVDRTIDRLYKTNSLGAQVSNIYDRVRRKPELGERLLNAALEIAEKNSTSANAVWLEQMMIDVNNPPPPEITSRQMLQYFKILIAAARSKYQYTAWPLRRALPNIQKVDPKLYAEGRAIVADQRRLLSKERVAKEEADDKIEWAQDRLARAISEAEAATTIEMKDYFWNRASQIASPMRKGDGKRSIDLLMKATPMVGTSDPKTRDRMLGNKAYWAQAYREFESAKYAIDFIEDDQLRAGASLKYASEFARWNYQDRQMGAKMIDEAIGEIEKTAPNYSTVCEIVSARIYLTVFSTYTTINDATARTVRIVNTVPTNGADARAGTDERNEFVKRIRPILPCAVYAFKPINMSPRNTVADTPPDPELANGIKIKELRIAAQIEAEKYRKYPPVP